MDNRLYLQIALRIVALCVVGMLHTYLPEHFRGFFGDTLIPLADRNTFEPDNAWDWGARHYWYFWMMVSLFILSVVNCGIWIANKINE